MKGPRHPFVDATCDLHHALMITKQLDTRQAWDIFYDDPLEKLQQYTWRLPHIAAIWCNFWIGKQVVFVLGMGSGAEDVGAWIVPLWLKEFCWRLAWIVSVAAASYYSIIAFNWHHITQVSPLVPARGPALWPGLAPARAPARGTVTAECLIQLCMHATP